MIAVSQTASGGPNALPEQHGDCFRACICSLLEVPINTFESPSPSLPYDEWDRAWRDQLRPHGLWMIGFELAGDEDLWWLPPSLSYWIASVPSLNLGCDSDGKPIRHAVVMRGAWLAHDPALTRRYKRVRLCDVLALRLLIRCDPAVLKGEGDG